VAHLKKHSGGHLYKAASGHISLGCPDAGCECEEIQEGLDNNYIVQGNYTDTGTGQSCDFEAVATTGDTGGCFWEDTDVECDGETESLQLFLEPGGECIWKVAFISCVAEKHSGVTPIGTYIITNCIAPTASISVEVIAV
jgi:hypothetical protein